MFFNTTPVQVWRLTPAVSNLADPTWAMVATYNLSVQPFTGDEANHAGQVMENVRDLLISNDPEIDIRKNDELTFHGEYARVQYIERFRSGVINHAEIYTADTQWVRT